MQQTGGGSNPSDDLTDINKKLISLIGTASVIGESELKEGGINAEENLNSEVLDDHNENLPGTEEETIIIMNVPEENDEETLELQRDSEVGNNKTTANQADYTGAAPTSVSKDKVKRKVNMKRNTTKNKLVPTALEEYSNSSYKFSESINQLSSSIDPLAESNFALANSISKILAAE